MTDSSTGIGFRFGIDADGNYGYIKDGADAVTPFNKTQVLIGEESSLVNIYKYDIECGFRPTMVYVEVWRGTAANSLNAYRDGVISKIGTQTNNTVGLPTSLSDAIYDTGFRLNQGYNYDGWVLKYIAIGE